nr:ribonuclease H-like domain-containing protein [Tanacetum cinerariifolium]
MAQHIQIQLQFSPTTVSHPTTIVSDQHASAIIQNLPVNPNPDSVHPIVTHFRVRTNRLTKPLNSHVSLVSPLPKSYCEAFNDVNWHSATRDEYNALIKNSTWTLIPRPSDVNVGFDVDETFSPVVKPRTIRKVLSLATSRHWPIHQLDVKNAILHGDLSKTVYMHEPSGFGDSTHPVYKKYAVEILERAGMVNCNPSQTSVDTESKLGTTGDVVSDLTLYRSLAGSLQYLTFTRLDISYAVQQLFFFSTTDLVVYSDADWAGCLTTRRSTLGYCVFLGNNLLSWSVKSQTTLSHSSAEAEYRGVANAVAETCWLHNLLREFHTSLSSTTLVYYDNVSAVYLSSNPIQHQRTKHIEIDIHFVRDLVATGQVWVFYVPSRYQFADIFTKGLRTALFEEFCSSLSV